MDIDQDNHSLVKSLHCSKCGTNYDFKVAQNFATCCNKTLLFTYKIEANTSKSILRQDMHSMWKYERLLPILNTNNIVSLHEGNTPILKLAKINNSIYCANLYLKDETNNPTGSFKARGISVAVSKLKELGIKKCIIPTAGNAGGALAAYCAKATIEATIVMPRRTPKVFKDECNLYGAKLILIDGLINDCGVKAGQMNKEGDYFDMSTLKEPYRLEGKKTMGYEIAEQFNWELPDIIIYPAGGGTGLIGIWKAFKEMIALGWIKNKLPKMVAVQTSKCSAIQAAIDDPIHWKDLFKADSSIANGLAVPYPFGMDLILEVIEESKGMVVTIKEEEIKEVVIQFSKTEGILISPEGAATYMAIDTLRNKQLINEDTNVLLLNTGSGYKYLENII